MTCSIDGCGRRAEYTTLALCRRHYQARRKPRKPPRTRHHTRYGYVRILVPGHPVANLNGWAPEHRVVAWDTFGPFDRSLHVHHKNGIKDDNRPENLEVLTANEHALEHGEQRRVIDIQKAVEMYLAGSSTREIADHFDSFSGNVSRILRAAGVSMRTSSEVRCADDPSERDVLEAWRCAGSAVEVADRLGVTVMVARRLMRKHGLPAFPAGRRKGWAA